MAQKIAHIDNPDLGDLGAVLNTLIDAINNGDNSNVALLAVDGAIPPHASGTYIVTKVTAAALTLAAPTAGTDDGITIAVYARTNVAHVITMTGLLEGGTAAVNTITFPTAGAGAGISLRADNGKWVLRSNVACTLG